MLNNEKSQYVYEHYYKQNHDKELLEKSSQTIVLPESIVNFCEKNEIKIENYPDINPSEEFYFTFSPYLEGKLNIKYSAELTLSKLTKVYEYKSRFKMKNPDPDRIDPILSGYSDMEYTNLQFLLREVVEKELGTLGYERFYTVDIFEKVEGLIADKENRVVGDSYITVGDILFEDYLWKLPDEDEG